MLLVVFSTVVVTLIAVVVALNFTTGEKKIEQKIARLYAVVDPDFARAMGVLLGSAIVGGNRFEALLNGDRIFPPCSTPSVARKKASRSKPTSIGRRRPAGSSPMRSPNARAPV